MKINTIPRFLRSTSAITQASEVMRTRSLLQSLSKQELLTHVLYGIEADLSYKKGAQAAQAREADFKKLVKQGYISGHATQDKTQLTAPVVGIVQQLAVHSVGSVVTSAQPLMIVVLDSPTVTAEVSIANQDIGFVNAGQTAAVKLET